MRWAALSCPPRAQCRPSAAGRQARRLAAALRLGPPARLPSAKHLVPGRRAPIKRMRRDHCGSLGRWASAAQQSFARSSAKLTAIISARLRSIVMRGKKTPRITIERNLFYAHPPTLKGCAQRSLRLTWPMSAKLTAIISARLRSIVMRGKKTPRITIERDLFYARPPTLTGCAQRSLRLTWPRALLQQSFARSPAKLTAIISARLRSTVMRRKKTLRITIERHLFYAHPPALTGCAQARCLQKRTQA